MVAVGKGLDRAKAFHVAAGVFFVLVAGRAVLGNQRMLLIDDQVAVGVEFLAQTRIGRMEHIVLDESVALAHAEFQRQFHVLLLAGDHAQLVGDALEGICPSLQSLLVKLTLGIADRRPRAFFTPRPRNQMQVADVQFLHLRDAALAESLDEFQVSLVILRMVDVHVDDLERNRLVRLLFNQRDAVCA